jgi:hypothetical protein
MTTSSPWRSVGSVATMTALAALSACAAPGREKAAVSPNTMVALNDTQLGNIRGGFDMSPNLSVDFGFQQTTSVNNHQVSQILVPDMTIGPWHNGAVNQTGSPSNPIYTVVPGPTAQNSTPSGQPIVPAVVTNNGGVGMSSKPSLTPTSVVMPSVAIGGGSGGGFVSNVQSQVSVAQDQGITNIMTQLGGGGLTSIIQSSANNALVQQATTINLSISGLMPLLSSQSSNFALNTALALGAALHH